MNLVENRVRSIAIGRKNFLFAGSHEATQCDAILYSLLNTTYTSHDENGCGCVVKNQNEAEMDALSLWHTKAPIRLREQQPHRSTAADTGFASVWSKKLDYNQALDRTDRMKHALV